jgi:hypothetical protein
MPIMPPTKRPSQPVRSAIIRKRTPIVADRKAHWRIFPLCRQAVSSPSLIDACPPARRLEAALTKATLKKVMTK